MKAKRRGARPGLLLWLLPLLVQFFAATSHDPNDCLAHHADEIAHHQDDEHQHHKQQAHEDEHHQHASQHEHHAAGAQHEHHDDAAHDHDAHDVDKESAFGAASHHHGAQVSIFTRDTHESDCASCQWLGSVTLDRAMQSAQTFADARTPHFQPQTSLFSLVLASQRNRGPPAF